MLTRLGLALGGLVPAFLAASAYSQTVFTSNTVIASGDTTYDGQDITVRGCTVTINGSHSFNSLILQANAGAGVVTHAAGAGMTLTIATDLEIDATCSIALSGRGNATDAGAGAGVTGTQNFSGGGGYGGRGGDGSPTGLGGNVYGSITQPADLGSGGATDPFYHQAGGAGGGSAHLIVGGSLLLNGDISANGSNGGPSGYSGGGSGGSIWISAATVTGGGAIHADGGSSTYGGAGGGGRVALYYTTLTLPQTSITAYGSAAGGHPGSAGTVYLKAGSDRGTVFIDDGGRTPGVGTAFDVGSVLDANLVVRGHGRVGPARGETSVVMSVTGDVTVESDGFFGVDAAGFASDGGPGAGAGGTHNFSGGGGHGGRGGNGSIDGIGGVAYGSVFTPTEAGSGGATDPFYQQAGGAGGGQLRLSVGGTLTIDGAITAGGGNGGPSGYSGGGAGGSIWIDAPTIAGAGSISANGGTSTYGGGGGGGRVALYYSTLSLAPANIQAYGSASGGQTGGAGTVYLRQGTSRGTIFIDDGNRTLGAPTNFGGAASYDADMVIRNNGRVGPGTGETGLDLTVQGDLTIAANGYLVADAHGSGSDTGAGHGLASTQNFSGGGGYGGWGGTGGADGYGGGVYGSIFSPTDLGSGGATDPFYQQAGGAGGGAVRLVVGGALTVDGVLSSNGAGGGPSGYSGGGSGGSVWINAGGIAGTGTLSASGGSSTYGGGGGGGRVALYYTTLTLPAANIQAFGSASGGQTGGAGTVYTKQGPARGTIIIDNGLRTLGAPTAFPDSTALDADVVIRRNGAVGPGVGDHAATLNVLGDLTIASDGRLSADARGFASDQGPGAGVTGANNFGGGGGYGGHGGTGNEASALGGPTYGSDTQPTDLGSGGAHDAFYHQAGGAGGGALRLIVGGNLTIDGSVSSRGGNGGPSGYSGAGSGGSVWITAQGLAGSGVINANGGTSTYGGGGGGGRIAIDICGSQVPPTMTVTANAGTGGTGAQAGTLFLGPPDFFITTQPRDAHVCPDATATFAVVVSGGSPTQPTYRWQLEAAPAASGVWADLSDGPIAGATTVVSGTGSPTLSAAHADAAMYGRRFRCVMTSDCGSLPSAAASLLPNSGDFNGDGDVGTDADIAAFFACLGGSCCPTCGSADFNGDGDIGTDADIESFFRVLGGGPC